jgi:hypothetical protein
MVLLKYGCLVGTLYPFSIIPQSEIIEPRPNLIIALLVGILFYLGYAMPEWLEQTLIRFELNPRLLQQNLWLVGFISVAVICQVKNDAFHNLQSPRV